MDSHSISEMGTGAALPSGSEMGTGAALPSDLEMATAVRSALRWRRARRKANPRTPSAGQHLRCEGYAVRGSAEDSAASFCRVLSGRDLADRSTDRIEEFPSRPPV